MATVIASVQAPIVAGTPLFGSMSELLNDPLAAYLRARSRVRRRGALPRRAARAACGALRACSRAEGAQQVLATRAANFRKDNAFYEELRESVGNGLLTSQDDDYLRQRRLIQPLFTRRRVDGYAAARSPTEADGRWSSAGARRPATDAWTCVARDDTGSRCARSPGSCSARTWRRPSTSSSARFPVHQRVRTASAATPPSTSPRTWPTPANRRAAAATDASCTRSATGSSRAPGGRRRRGRRRRRRPAHPARPRRERRGRQPRRRRAPRPGADLPAGRPRDHRHLPRLRAAPARPPPRAAEAGPGRGRPRARRPAYARRPPTWTHCRT